MPILRMVSVFIFLVLGLVVLPAIMLPNRAFAESDQVAAASILGTDWRHLSCRAGMVLAGTVLDGRSEGASTDRPVPSITLRLRVDRAIIGVPPGPVLTIHEWAGAWSQQKPMRPGDRFLLFLYAPSYIGLTSPVDGPRGQIRLDSTGRYIVERPLPRFPAPAVRSVSSPPNSSAASITLDQVARAIRSARGN